MHLRRSVDIDLGLICFDIYTSKLFGSNNPHAAEKMKQKVADGTIDAEMDDNYYRSRWSKDNTVSGILRLLLFKGDRSERRNNLNRRRCFS